MWLVTWNLDQNILNMYFLANTRVIKQSSLQKFQDEMDAVQKDPYRVVMKQSKLPMSLLHDRVKAHVSIKTLLTCSVFKKGKCVCGGVFYKLLYVYIQ